jgi:hypothetical protein
VITYYPPPAVWPASFPYNILVVPYYSKISPRLDALTLATVNFVNFNLFTYEYLTANVEGFPPLTQMLGTTKYSLNQHFLLDHVRGNLTKYYLYKSHSILNINVYRSTDIPDPSFSTGLSRFIMAGVPYQIYNHTVFVTDGDSNLYYFSFHDCYNKVPANTYEQFIDICNVPNCMYCNIFNPNQCKVCKTRLSTHSLQ